MVNLALIFQLFFFMSIFILKSSHAFLSRNSKLRSPSSSFASCATSTSYSKSDPFEVIVNGTSSFDFDGDVLIVPLYKPSTKDKDVFSNDLKSSIPNSLSNTARKIISDIIDEGAFKADECSKFVARVYDSSLSFKYVALVGLGADPKKEKGDMEIASALRIGRLVSNIAKDINSNTAGIVMPEGFSNSGFTQFYLGLSDAAYQDNRFKKVPEEGFKPFPLSAVTLLGLSDTASKTVALNSKLTQMIASGVDFAKDLVAAPPNYKTPSAIADIARELSRECNLECKILGREECERLGMGGYLGVQQGSNQEPQFIHLTFKPNGGVDTGVPVTKVALVGKGLTFDSGGYNLKVGAGSMIELMKFDMGGCGAVLGAAKAIGLLRPKNVEVHFITAVCENMISADAMKPGDILTASNGKTIEVLNTDAEGRLTLADALVYADNLDVDVIVDLATLTGACIVALGEKLAGLYSSDPDLLADLQNAGRRTDEGLWPLPLEPAYKEHIKSTLADLKNVGAKGAGSITAALFLREFVEKAKWAHIDMAGPVWDTSKSKPTGFGVKLLVDYILNIKPTHAGKN